MIRIASLAVLLTTSIFIFIACDEVVEPPPPCPLVVNPAIEIKVFDRLTSALLSGVAHGLVTNGQYADSLRVCTMDAQGHVLTRCGAHGASGTFYVSLTAAGYLPWDTTGVVVPRDRCGNLTTYLEVALVPPRMLQLETAAPGVNGLPNPVLQPPAPRDGQR